MKKIFFSTLLLAMVTAVPVQTMAGVDVNVSIGLPPPIVFASPPEMIVLPETYVYVVPDVDMDIFFYGGWWWRPWEGHWYRSHYYDRGWGYYQSVPSFYVEIPSGWRNNYRDHRWGGHQWNYQRIPHHQLKQNWKSWEKDKHWEKQQTWGVQGLKPRTLSKQPSQVVQPKSPGKPKVQEADKFKSQKTDKPKVRKAVKPKTQKVVKPKFQETDKTQHSNQQEGTREKGQGEKQGIK